MDELSRKSLTSLRRERKVVIIAAIPLIRLFLPFVDN